MLWLVTYTSKCCGCGCGYGHYPTIKLNSTQPRAECHPGQNVSGQNVTQPPFFRSYSYEGSLLADVDQKSWSLYYPYLIVFISGPPAALKSHSRKVWSLAMIDFMCATLAQSAGQIRALLDTFLHIFWNFFGHSFDTFSNNPNKEGEGTLFAF